MTKMAGTHAAALARAVSGTASRSALMTMIRNALAQ
jgi:hypothetical protein